jgi:hypothetical protein
MLAIFVPRPLARTCWFDPSKSALIMRSASATRMKLSAGVSKDITSISIQLCVHSFCNYTYTKVCLCALMQHHLDLVLDAMCHVHARKNNIETKIHQHQIHAKTGMNSRTTQHGFYNIKLPSGQQVLITCSFYTALCVSHLCAMEFSMKLWWKTAVKDQCR